VRRGRALPDTEPDGSVTDVRNFTLVLGGGGMRGLAHIGVLEALEERGFLPQDVVGSSVGALIAASWCAGTSVAGIKELALGLRRRDLFQVAHGDMALRRMRAPALYRTEPLAHFIRGLLGDLTFEELERPLLVNTVDINTGTQVFWGQPGLRDLPVAEAVLASCALPGFIAPHRIGDRYFVDGAAVANLPVHPSARADRDLVFAVDIGARYHDRATVQEAGFAAVYARAIEIAVQRMDETALRSWLHPPLVLVRPKVWDIHLLSFDRNADLLRAGYVAANEPFDEEGGIPAPGSVGVYPRRRYRVTIDRERCVGCRACVSVGPPGLFELDDEGKAVLTDPEPHWSPMDGVCVAQCPTRAISAVRVQDGPAVGTA